MLLSILVFMLLSAFAQALAFNAPRATLISPVEPALVPQPTKAPAHVELLRRQASASSRSATGADTDTWLTALLGTNSLCGYIGGLPENSYFCGSTFTCDLIVGSASAGTTSFGQVACCNDDICGLRTTCVDYVDYWSSSACGSSCISDSYIEKCTALTAPYCNGVRFGDELAEDWYCDISPITTWQSAFTTSIGEADDRGFITDSWDPKKSTTGAIITATDSVTVTFSAAASVAPVTMTIVSDPTPAVTKPPVTSYPPTTITSSLAPVPSTTGQIGGSISKKSTPIAAIVGGVVGGVVGIGVLLALLWFFCWRTRKIHTPNAVQTTPTAYTAVPHQQQQQQQQYQSPPPNYYNPSKIQSQMVQNEIPGQGQTVPGGLTPGYFNPNHNPSQPGHPIHEAESNPTSPEPTMDGYASHRVSNATELESPGSPTPSHAVSAVTSTINIPFPSNNTQQQQHIAADGIQEMSATSGPFGGNLEGIHELPEERRY